MERNIVNSLVILRGYTIRYFQPRQPLVSLGLRGLPLLIKNVVCRTSSSMTWIEGTLKDGNRQPVVNRI